LLGQAVPAPASVKKGRGRGGGGARGSGRWKNGCWGVNVGGFMLRW
jgi:hypothetical protein